MTNAFSWGDRLPVLQARRLRLRGLEPGDASSILEIFGDDAVMEFWSSPPLRDLGAAAGLIAEIQELFESRRLFQWGICSQDNDEVLGTCTLYHLEHAHRRAEIGFALGRKSWGQGLATEAVETLIRFTFETLGLHRLEADADPANERSLRLLEKQGFRREGYLRERWHHLGKLQDAVFLGLLKPEWRL